MSRFVLSLATCWAVGCALAAGGNDLAATPLSEIPAFEAEAPPEPPLPPALADALEHAKAAIEGGSSQAALHDINNALAVSTVSPSEALYYLALARSNLGRHVDARITAEYAVSKAPRDPRINFLLGRLYYQQGHAEQAIGHLRRATLADGANDPPPEWTAAWAWLGEVLVEEGYLRAAAEAFGAFDEAVLVEHREHRSHSAVKAVLERYPNGLLERRIELLRRANLTQELVAATRDTLALRPDDLGVMRSHLRALLDAGEAEQAWDICERLLSRPEAPLGLLQISAEAAVATGQLETWIDQRLNTTTLDQATKRRIAEIVAELGEYAAAARIYAAVLEAEPQDLYAAWSGSLSYLKADDAPAALTLLIQVLRLNPEAATVPGNVFDDWVRILARDSDLLAKVDSALRISSADDFPVTTLRALVAELRGEAESARTLIAQAIAAKPACLALRLYLPRAALAQYRWQLALDAIEPVLADHPELAAAHAIQGIASDGLDEDELAEEALLKAIELAPRSTEYLLALARVHQRQGSWVSAQRYAQQALEVDPVNGVALELAVDTYLSDGKHEIAGQVVSTADVALMPADALRRARLAVNIVRRGLNEETRARLSTLFERYPDDVWIGRKLVNTLYAVGEIEPAFKLIQELHTRFPDDEGTRLLLIEVAARKLDYATAIQQLEMAIERYPRRGRLLGRLALLYGADFQVENERRVWSRLIELKADSALGRTAREQRVDSFARFSDWDGALAELDTWPNEPEFQALQTANRLRILTRAERYSESIAVAEAALAGTDEAAPNRKEYQGWLIQALFAAEQYDRVLKLLDTYRDADPEFWLWFEFSLKAFLAAEKYDEAWALFNDYQPNSDFEAMEFELFQADVLSKRGDVERALVVLEQALNRKVRRSELDRTAVRRAIASVLIDAGRGEEAVERCLRWLEEVPPHQVYQRGERLRLSASVYQELGQMDAYAQTLSELRTLQPKDPGILNDLGYTWVDAGQNLEEATRMIEQAVAAFPLRAAYLDSLGWAAYKAGDFPKAIKWLERAARLFDGNDPIVIDHLGDAYWRVGDQAAARRTWQKALERLEAAEDNPQEELTAAVRAKLAALDAGDQPVVADVVREVDE